MTPSDPNGFSEPPATRALFARTLLQFHWCQVGERGSCPESGAQHSTLETRASLSHLTPHKWGLFSVSTTAWQKKDLDLDLFRFRL